MGKKGGDCGYTEGRAIRVKNSEHEQYERSRNFAVACTGNRSVKTELSWIGENSLWGGAGPRRSGRGLKTAIGRRRARRREVFKASGRRYRRRRRCVSARCRGDPATSGGYDLSVAIARTYYIVSAGAHSALFLSCLQPRAHHTPPSFCGSSDCDFLRAVNHFLTPPRARKSRVHRVRTRVDKSPRGKTVVFVAAAAATTCPNLPDLRSLTDRGT